MYQNKLKLLMINIAQHFLTFGDIKSNKINSKHTDISQRFLCPPCWDYGNSSQAYIFKVNFVFNPQKDLNMTV